MIKGDGRAGGMTSAFRARKYNYSYQCTQGNDSEET
jgi:hypothetical protein